MGDAAASTSKATPAPRVSLLVRANAHVDVAHLDEGCVSKRDPLVVSGRVALTLLARHPYLEATEG